MPKRRAVPFPSPRSYELSLRQLSPRQNVAVVGREAILAWFHRHGFRGKDGVSPPAWRTVLDWQKAAGEPFFCWTPSPNGFRLGEPVSTVIILTRWLFCQSQALGPRGWEGSKLLHRRRVPKS